DAQVEPEGAAAAGGVADEVDPAAEPALLLAQDLDLAQPGTGRDVDRDPARDVDDQLADPDPGLDGGGPGRHLELAKVDLQVADGQLVLGQVAGGTEQPRTPGDTGQPDRDQGRGQDRPP